MESIRLTGLWLHKTKDGRQYMAGRLGEGRLLVLSNRAHKQNAKDPDYLLVLSPRSSSSKGKPQPASPAPAPRQATLPQTNPTGRAQHRVVDGIERLHHELDENGF